MKRISDLLYSSTTICLPVEISPVVWRWLPKVSALHWVLITSLFAVMSACNQKSETVGPWMPPGTAPPSSANVEIRSAGEKYEIEVQHPKGFQEGSLEWTLNVGNASFLRYRASSTVGGYYGLVFTLSSAEFEALREGAPIVVHYGPDVSAGWTFGTFSKSDLLQ